MRKILLILSFMALPLAACDQQTETPPQTDPAQQVTDAPAPPADGDAPVSDNTATDRSAIKPSMNEPQPEPAMPTDKKTATE